MMIFPHVVSISILSMIIISLPACTSFTSTGRSFLKDPSFLHKTSKTCRYNPQTPWNIAYPSNNNIRACPLFATKFNKNNTNKDPYAALSIPFGTIDKKVIKRAYKRAAMKYHPDVNQDDPDAADKFIEICNAYELLSGGGKNAGSSAGAASSGASDAESSAGYEPPHRRSSSYNSNRSSSSYTGSNDWRDYIPYNVDDEKYDAGGDSFGSIFSDLFTGAAAAAAGYKSGSSSGGILEDLVDFLEGTVDGFASEAGYDADPDLIDLLSHGSLEEIRIELEDAELLVKQLETKCDGIKKDIARVTNDLEINVKNSSQNSATQVLRLDEELNEEKVSVEAREKVVVGYLTKARKRLILLQDRVRELRSQGRSANTGGNNPGASGYSSASNTYSDVSSSSTTTSQEKSYSSYTSTSSESSASNSSSNSNNASGSNRESFGSSGRGRGRSRSRQKASNPAPKSYSTPSSPPPPRQTTYARTSSTRASTSNASRSSNLSNTNSANKEFVPPHRRKSSSSDYSDKKRLREFKVDEEFDKLKKDLGL